MREEEKDKDDRREVPILNEVFQDHEQPQDRENLFCSSPLFPVFSGPLVLAEKDSLKRKESAPFWLPVGKRPAEIHSKKQEDTYLKTGVKHNQRTNTILMDFAR